MTVFDARARLAAGIFSAAVLAGPTLAQPKGEPRTATLQQLVDCRKLTDAAARLACYDTAAAALDQAEAKGDIVVVDREQARKVRRQAFGFTLPSLNLFDRGEKAEEIETLTAKVEAAYRGPDGKWRVRLEGGQTWRQTDTTDLSRYPKAGGTVTVKRAALGSFMMNTGGAGAMRVHRDE